ncbi:MAG: 3-phosphoshikimate 1-carboxyvinyltransferase [Acidimicrobiales bacterium]|jgi:3-phosphoshikimate 1-carboxyvinyltransferase|nr:3-phosphoshikimate 1-carboxyvinyltransferase [Acidimicrobiales bacterium]
MRIPGPRRVTGRLRPPGDKSVSHRALLLGALADGTSTISGLSDGDDVARTARAVSALGARIDGPRITGGRDRLHAPADVVDCGNSGTAIRLLAGVSASLPFRTVLDGDGSVRTRPMGRVTEPLAVMGARIDSDYAPLTIDGGGLHGIDYTPRVPSAQVKSAILLAGLGAEGDTVVREPVPTRAHTEELLALCGADIEVGPGVARVRASKLAPFALDIPGDPSQAAFWIVAACLAPGSDLTVAPIYVGPARTAFIDVLLRMGADLEIGPGTVRARYSALHPTDIGGAEVPGLIDEIPVLAVAAAMADGISVVRDAAELRVKESDRIEATVAMLQAFGVVAEPTADGLAVNGTGVLTGGGVVDSRGDHRIAMAAAVAGLVADGGVTIEGWESVATSYPGFEEDLRRCAS